jgi:hypothetical protein
LSALAQDIFRPTRTTAPVLTRRDGLRIVRRFLRDLEEQSLHVILTPSKHWEVAEQGGKIRTVQYENPEWYQAFCCQYRAHRGSRTTRCDWCCQWHHKKSDCSKGKARKPRDRQRKLFDASVKRRDTIRGLNELLRGDCKSEYAIRLRDFIKTHWSKYL